MNIYITRTKGFEQRSLKKVWELLALRQGPMKFILLDKPMFFDKKDFGWAEFFTSMSDVRKEYNLNCDDILVAITELSNDMNWFSAPDPDGDNNIFIHGKEWDNYIYCSNVYPIAYEVVANVLQRKMFRKLQDEEKAHDPAIGCMNDMCSWKPDITFKLRTADICEDCLIWAKDSNIGDDTIKQAIDIFSFLRKKMLYSSSIQMEDVFDNHLPSNVAITKRKISSTSEPLRKFLFLIDHFDSLIRTAVIFWSAINYSEKEKELFFQTEGLTNRPSLGAWLLSLQHLAADFQSNIQINSSINNKIKSLISLVEKANLVALRNEKRGHGYIDCSDNTYKSTFLENLPIVTEVEELLTPLFMTNKMHFVNRASLVGHGLLDIWSLELTGSYAIYSEKQRKIQTSDLAGVPIEGHVYIYNEQQEKWFDLKPFLIFDNCPICQHQRLLVFDGDRVYIDPLEGHRVEL